MANQAECLVFKPTNDLELASTIFIISLQSYQLSIIGCQRCIPIVHTMLNILHLTH